MITDRDNRSRLGAIGLLALAALAALACGRSDPDIGDRVPIKVEHYDPFTPRPSAINRAAFRLMREDPELKVEPYRRMQIAGGLRGESSRLLSIAGKTAPDVQFIVIHDLRPYSQRNFFYPLNEFIGEDKDGDGYISNEEATWEDWKTVPEFYKRTATLVEEVDGKRVGKIYGVPNPQIGMAAIIYRKDIFRSLGIELERPPQDWEELYRLAQRLTDPKAKIPGAKIQRGRHGFLLSPEGWMFCAWVWAAGGDILMQERVSPRTGKVFLFPQEELDFIVTHDDGTTEDLSREPGRWTATFGEKPGQEAAAFYHRLVHQRWVRNPETGGGVDVTEEDIAKGFVVDPETGARIEFAPDDVIKGVARANFGAEADNMNDLLRRGEVAMTFFVIRPELFKNLEIPPHNIGFFAVPPKEKGNPPAMLAHYHWWALSRDLAERSPEARQKAWKVLSTLTGTRGVKWAVEDAVEAGMAKFLDINELRRYGLEEYATQIPEEWRKSWHEVLQYARTEPVVGFWSPIKHRLLTNNVLGFVLTDENFDYATAIQQQQLRANSGMMFKRRKEELDKYRPVARVIVAAAFFFVGLVLFKMFGALRERALAQEKKKLGGSTRSVYAAWMPWLLLAPAMLLVSVWSYYPLVRGSLMAFQHVELIGGSEFVGLDNFLNAWMDGSFFVYLAKTFKYVFISIILSFLSPIILAILLSEVPRFRTMFRTFFFLPQVSSGLVILFLWKMLYNPTPQGALNKALMAVIPGMEAQDWLNDPTWTMIAVILPSAWAHMGFACLIYLAALKSVPSDLYEAADVDGAGIWSKFRHIMVPTLMPLIIINFVGAFIHTCHQMGNVFALTGGGPGDETMVLALAIWYEAFAFLRFGTATAMAMVLGALLISFTLLQLRILKKVEFRRAEEQ